MAFQQQCDLACCEYLRVDDEETLITIGQTICDLECTVPTVPGQDRCRVRFGDTISCSPDFNGLCAAGLTFCAPNSEGDDDTETTDDDGVLTIDAGESTDNNSQAVVGGTTGALFLLLILVLVVALVVVRRRKLQHRELFAKERSSAVVQNPTYACPGVHSISSNDNGTSSTDTKIYLKKLNLDPISSIDDPTSSSAENLGFQSHEDDVTSHRDSMYSEMPPLEESVYEQFSESTGMHVNAIYQGKTTAPEEYSVPLEQDSDDYETLPLNQDAPQTVVADYTMATNDVNTPEYELSMPLGHDYATTEETLSI